MSSFPKNLTRSIKTCTTHSLSEEQTQILGFAVSVEGTYEVQFNLEFVQCVTNQNEEAEKNLTLYIPQFFHVIMSTQLLLCSFPEKVI